MKITQLMLFWGLWFTAFSTRSLISPFLPIIEETFAVNHASAAGLLFFVSVGSTIAVGMTGYLSMRIGYKRLIIWSFLLAAGALIGLHFAGNYACFAVFLFFFGVGGGFYLPCAIPILTEVFDRAHWGKAISVHETAAGFSLLCVPFLVSLAIGVMPWRQVILIPAGFFLLLVVLFWMTGPEPAHRRRRHIPISSMLSRIDFWVILALWVISAIGVMGIYNIIPLFLVDEKGIALETSNQLLSLSRVGGLAGQICIGFFMDRFRTKTILLSLSIASGLSALGLAAAQPPWLTAVMLVLQGTFCAVFFPAGIVALAKLTKPEERSLYTGLIVAIAGIVGMGIAPAVLGAIADAFSFQIGIALLGLGTLMVCPLIRLLRDI